MQSTDMYMYTAAIFCGSKLRLVSTRTTVPVSTTQCTATVWTNTVSELPTTQRTPITPWTIFLKLGTSFSRPKGEIIITEITTFHIICTFQYSDINCYLFSYILISMCLFVLSLSYLFVKYPTVIEVLSMSTAIAQGLHIAQLIRL